MEYYGRHARELATRLRRVFIAWLISLILFLSLPASAFTPEEFMAGTYLPLSVYLVNKITYYLLSSPLTGGVNITFIAEHLSMGFEIWFLSSLFFSVLIALPIFVVELWRFIEPGLYEHEKRILKKTFYPVMASFILGCLFGLFILVPIILRAFVMVNLWFNVEPIISYTDFVGFIASTILFSGVFMTAPVIVYGLILVGIVPVELLSKYRGPLYVGLYIIAAIITPDGGTFGSAVLALPIIILFEIVIQLGKRKKGKRVNCCRQ
ncbi:MAG: twin-arginine translocase subunit TatC [Thermosphaera sp.]